MKNNSKKAFSLAEGMVMLVIVSILMALAAPLIVKKSRTDARTLWLTNAQARRNNAGNPVNGISVSGGMGDFQRVGIGTNAPQAKLHVRFNNAEPDMLFQAGPVNDAGTNFGLRVNSTGATNILACVPDWESGAAINIPNTPAEYNPPSFGYVAVRTQCVNINVGGGTAYAFCPPIDHSNVGANDSVNQYRGETILLPVNPDVGVSTDTGQAGANGRPANPLAVAGVGDMFIPCLEGERRYELP